jgi:hypothetical protein
VKNIKKNNKKKDNNNIKKKVMSIIGLLKLNPKNVEIKK